MISLLAYQNFFEETSLHVFDQDWSCCYFTCSCRMLQIKAYKNMSENELGSDRSFIFPTFLNYPSLFDRQTDLRLWYSRSTYKLIIKVMGKTVLQLWEVGQMPPSALVVVVACVWGSFNSRTKTSGRPGFDCTCLCSKFLHEANELNSKPPKRISASIVLVQGGLSPLVSKSWLQRTTRSS